MSGLLTDDDIIRQIKGPSCCTRKTREYNKDNIIDSLRSDNIPTPVGGATLREDIIAVRRIDEI